MTYIAIDAAADAARERGLTVQETWSLLMHMFPQVHSNVLAERIAAVHGPC